MAKYRILVVDDEEDICEILAFNLRNAGYDVDTVNSAEDALFKMKNDYDLLLLDIMMEGISGLKLAQLLREDYNNNTPIIFISALYTESDILNGFNKGGDHRRSAGGAQDDARRPDERPLRHLAHGAF